MKKSEQERIAESLTNLLTEKDKTEPLSKFKLGAMMAKHLPKAGLDEIRDQVNAARLHHMNQAAEHRASGDSLSAKHHQSQWADHHDLLQGLWSVK